MFIFENTDRKAFDEYMDRYGRRFGNTGAYPRVYKYLRKNRSVTDISLEDPYEYNPPKDADIPPGSVISAWGDMDDRCEMIGWKHSRGRRGKPFN